MNYQYPFILLEVPHRAPPTAWMVRDEAHLIEAAAAATDNDLDDLDQGDLIEIITDDLSWHRVVPMDTIWFDDCGFAEVAWTKHWPMHQQLAAFRAVTDCAEAEKWDRLGRS